MTVQGEKVDSQCVMMVLIVVAVVVVVVLILVLLIVLRMWGLVEAVTTSISGSVRYDQKKAKKKMIELACV